MSWKLIKVEHTDWIQDDGGYYTLINWIDADNVRLDVMDTDDTPVVSFQGAASDVQKVAMRWIEQQSRKVCGITRQRKISFEHAAYIGAELARCELMQSLYVQD